MNNKTWSGRFNEPVSELVKQYTGSIDFDQRLAKWDIQGSLAFQDGVAFADGVGLWIELLRVGDDRCLGVDFAHAVFEHGAIGALIEDVDVSGPVRAAQLSAVLRSMLRPVEV